MVTGQNLARGVFCRDGSVSCKRRVLETRPTGRHFHCKRKTHRLLREPAAGDSLLAGFSWSTHQPQVTNRVLVFHGAHTSHR